MSKAFIAVVATVCVCTAAAAAAVYHFKNPRISAIEAGRDEFTYENTQYSSCPFYVTDSDLIKLGLTGDGSAAVYAVEREESPALIVVEGSDNTDLYKSELYEIPTSGQITRVFVNPELRSRNDNVFAGEHELELINKLTASEGQLTEYHIDNYYTQGNSFYFAYENCPVSCSANLGGYIAHVGGKWIFAPPDEVRQLASPSNSADINGIEIVDDELLQWLNDCTLTKYIE